MKLRYLTTLLTALTTLMSIAAAAVLATAPSATAAHTLGELPQRLTDTGLYVAGSVQQVHPQIASFTPQYTLWSDGADKRRWISLPPGASIDASNPDAWDFPVGTRLWKQFSQQGRRVETRYIERLFDGSWRFAAYVWSEDGSDAVLAPARGVTGLPVPQAPGGRYDVPSRGDCLACHEGAAVPVLGVGALQLSADRDPLAVHASAPAAGDIDLAGLVERGWLRYLDPALLQQPPRVAAATPTERAALGYLHANCGHCHNDNGSPAPVRLKLAQSVADAAGQRLRVLDSAVGAPSRYRAAGEPAAMQVVMPGHPDASVLALRMRSRHAQTQMPPLGTQLTDDEGVALVERWIANDLAAHTRVSANR